MLEPFDPTELQDAFEQLESKGREMLLECGADESDATFNRIAKMCYEGQVHELNVTLPSGDLDETAIESFVSRFEDQYEQRYSAAARLPEARAEIVTLWSEPTGKVATYEREENELTDETPPAEAEKPSREVYLSEKRPAIDVDVFDGTQLKPGNVIEGPAIINLNNTSMVAHLGQDVSIDKYHDSETNI